MNRYFQNNGKEYVFTDYKTKRPMLNYSWNETFLSAFNHVATGHGLYCDKTTITATFVHPEGRVKLINDGNRFFYLRDKDSGAKWNVAGYPIRTEYDSFQCTMGMGYAKYAVEKDKIKTDTRVFVNASDPCEIWTITLTNTDTKKRSVQVFPLVEWSLEGYVAKSDYFSYLSTEYIESESLMLAYNTADERPHNRYNAFMAISKKPASYDGSLNAFLGTYGSFSDPDALIAGKCSNTEGVCERLSSAAELCFDLEAGQSETVHILIGSFEEKETAVALKNKLFAAGKIESDFEALLANKDALVKSCYMKTPDERINSLFNTWTKQQVVLCSEVGRGNSRGYRDVLQDAWGYVSFNSEAAKKKILEALAHQYADGHAPRGWLPLDDRYYSDSPVWISMAVNEFVKETGDFSFLDISVPFLDGGEGSVLEHCRRAVKNLYEDRGAHGLVLAHNGDWNDSLTGIGRGGKGETAWTTIALHFALLQFIDILNQIGENTDEYEVMAAEIKQVVNDVAWDGEWFIEGYDDNAKAVGTKSETEGKIYLNSQSWAVISGVTTPEREQSAMQNVDKLLGCEYGVLTLYPPYTKTNNDIGRLTAFVPGIWENGCPYCHGSAFKIVADCMLGRGDKAFDTLSKVMPDHPNNPVEESGCEPYAFTNMYLGPQNPRAGFAMFSWITGTAGWMYRAVSQWMLGFHCEFNGFKIDPCVPKEWDEFEFTRTFRDNTYEIYVKNPNRSQSGVASVTVDGVKQDSNFIAYTGDGKSHKIEVIMK